MKVLLAIAHYYRPVADPIYGSNDETLRETRSAIVRRTIEAWRGHLEEATVLNVARKRYEPTPAVVDQLDIAVLVRGDDHLLDPDYCRAQRLRMVKVVTDEPLLLPFAAHRLFADSRDRYDMFVYSEEDLRPPDGWLLAKIAGFVEAFGPRRVAMPNRYEWGPSGATFKTYIDGGLKPAVTRPYFTALPDEPLLRQKLLGREIAWRRAANPHAGFFALTAEQVKHWVEQPHFFDLDCSFIRPLESAATLGVLKTFPIYKSAGADAGWLEIEHLDPRYSGLDLPHVTAAELEADPEPETWEGEA